MTSVGNEISNFERLPPRAVGYILDHLNNLTGTQGIINKADIPVVMKYASNLACTSTRMATKVNDLVATHLFLKSLSLKYQKAPEHFAALLNTPGARRWLWNYIIENGHDKDYQAIQSIYELASDVIKDAKEDGLIDTIGDFDKSSSPNPYYHQTKKGVPSLIIHF